MYGTLSAPSLECHPIPTRQHRTFRALMPQQQADTSDRGRCRVLSIQPHVVRGCVGNKCAVLPLQLLGLDVDIINTMQLACDYNCYIQPSASDAHELRLTGQDLHDLLDGLVKNDLLQDSYSHLLTGFVDSASMLNAIVRVHERLKASLTHAPPEALTYVCHPILGDQDKLYVPHELVDIYRSTVLPIANVLALNQFECELLAEMPLRTVRDVTLACKKLHLLGPTVVVITGFQESNEYAPQKPSERIVIGSQVTSGNLCEQYELRIPHIEERSTGADDLFAALLLAWLDRLPGDFQRVLETVVSTIQDVLQTTARLSTPGARDLKIVQARQAITNPTVRITASPLAVPLRTVWIDLDLLLGTEPAQAQQHWKTNLLPTAKRNALEDADVATATTRQKMVQEFIDEIARELAAGVSDIRLLSCYTDSSTQQLLEQWGGCLPSIAVTPACELRQQLLAAAEGTSPLERSTLVVSATPALLYRVEARSYRVVHVPASGVSSPLALITLGEDLQFYRELCQL